MKDIDIDISNLQNMEDRLVNNLNITNAEARNLINIFKNIAEIKIKESGKEWSDAVKEYFVSLIIEVIIQEVTSMSNVLNGIKDTKYDNIIEGIFTEDFCKQLKGDKD